MQTYDENNLSRGRKYDNLTFYNAMKSPLIEWNIRATHRYWDSTRFRKMPKIKETISMWCDYGDALFWGRGTDGKGGCCGNADSLFTDTAGEIKLDSIKGLREWYEKWDSASLPDNWTKITFIRTLAQRCNSPEWTEIGVAFYSSRG